MTIRPRARVRAAAILAMALLASVLGFARPAAAAAPTIAFFRGDTQAITADPAPVASLNQLRATVVVAHDPGVTITGMKANPQGATSGGYGAVQGTVRTLSGGSTYTVVDVAFTPGTGNWPGFTVANRQLDKSACIRLNTSAGETPEQCWSYKTASETDTSAVELPVPYDNHNTTQGTVFASSTASFHLAYTCDDNDTGTPGWGVCDQAQARLRNIGTGQIVALRCGIETTGSPNCENRSGRPAGAFNADDNTRRDFDLTVNGLARGKWVIEALYGNENNEYAYGATYAWSWLGHFFVNPTAPTVGLGATSSSGTLARPDSDATITYTATVSADAQIADWDLDQDAGNGFEVRERAALAFAGDSGGVPTFGAGQLVKQVALAGLGSGVPCGARVQVVDSGALAATDSPTAAIARAAGPATVACTTNRRPTGADQGPVAATSGGSPVAIALANADGDNDPRTCEIVTAPSRGTVSGQVPGTSCNRNYTPDGTPSGPDSFTYRVLDDHHGTSATYTVSIDVGDPVNLPSAPEIGAVAAGDGSASVSWAAPLSNGGGAISGYVVTPFVNGVAQPAQAFASTALTQVVTGLTNGTEYTFQVAATNSAGTGPNSASSAAVTPSSSITVPGAPTIGSVTPRNGGAQVTWVAPASNGGAAVTGYVVTPSIAGVPQAPVVFASTATTQVVTGLTNLTTYAFTVAATNLVGTGPESAASAAVTPAVWLPFANVNAFIDRQFLDFADRAPTAAERTAWTAALTGGTKSPSELIDELRRAPYWEGAQGSVIRLYSAYFLRAPDTSGLTYWIRKRRSGTALTTISSNFAALGEFKARYGKLSNAEFVTLIYRNVLDREPEPTGYAFWLKRLNNGTTRGSVMLSFSDASENVRVQANEVKVVTTYLGMLRRTPTQLELDGTVARLDRVEAPLTTITDVIAEILASAAYAARL